MNEENRREAYHIMRELLLDPEHRPRFYDRGFRSIDLAEEVADRLGYDVLDGMIDLANAAHADDAGRRDGLWERIAGFVRDVAGDVDEEDPNGTINGTSCHECGIQLVIEAGSVEDWRQGVDACQNCTEERLLTAIGLLKTVITPRTRMNPERAPTIQSMTWDIQRLDREIERHRTHRDQVAYALAHLKRKNGESGDEAPQTSTIEREAGLSEPALPNATRWLVVFKPEAEPLSAMPYDDRAGAEHAYERLATNWSEVFLCRVERGPRDLWGAMPDASSASTIATEGEPITMEGVLAAMLETTGRRLLVPSVLVPDPDVTIAFGSGTTRYMSSDSPGLPAKMIEPTPESSNRGAAEAMQAMAEVIMDPHGRLKPMPPFGRGHYGTLARGLKHIADPGAGPLCGAKVTTKTLAYDWGSFDDTVSDWCHECLKTHSLDWCRKCQKWTKIASGPHAESHWDCSVCGDDYWAENCTICGGQDVNACKKAGHEPGRIDTKSDPTSRDRMQQYRTTSDSDEK